MSENDRTLFLHDMFDNHLMMGDGSVINDISIHKLNEIAQDIYGKEELSKEEIEDLRYLIMICNVLYNRTDMDILPIEDGVYDLLLEKYKVYDKNFQVGSAVVDFKSQAEKREDYKEVVCPIYKIEEEPKDELHQQMFDLIMNQGQENIYVPTDLHKCPIYMEPDDISKRTHNTAHSHPDLVGTLDKCKFVLMSDAEAVGADKDPNVKILERDFFKKHIDMGIINPNDNIQMVLELKYDGISVEADCTNIVESARTRGDTGIGQASDITPILYGYPFPGARFMIGHKPIGVKFEAIMTKSNLYEFCKQKGYSYANCRTAIIGLFGASDAAKYRDYITLVPLAVDRNDVPEIRNRIDEIAFSNDVFSSHGNGLRSVLIEGTVPELLYQIKLFQDEAMDARSYLDFMYDGIVVSYLDEDIRAKLGRENFINKYSMAVKFDPLCKTTTFRGYTYEVGQNGNITPMIHYDPVEFLGTIHTKSTGSSLNRFKTLGLKYGDHINVTYTNDVMPYVTKPDCEYNRNNPNPVIEPPTECPICGSRLVVSDSGKTLRCPNNFCDGRKVARTVNMLAKLNLKGFGEQMIKAIDKYTLRELIDLDFDYLAPRIGEGNANNFLEIMRRLKTEKIYDYQIVGSLGFSGIASKKWAQIFQNITLEDLVLAYNSDECFWEEVVWNRLGCGEKTSQIIYDEMPIFIDDLEYIRLNMPNVISSKGIQKGKQIRFSGCRNQQLEEQLRKRGFDADSSAGVTKQTEILLIPYNGYVSGKTRKLSDTGKAIPIQEFIQNMDDYLS